MKFKAYAKLNLTLELTGVEEEFHTIQSVTVKVNLFDEIDIKTANLEEDRIFFSKSIRNKVSSIDEVIKLFKEKTAIKDHFVVFVNKNIPMGSGLGGGSSDAGYTLLALNAMYNNPLDKKALLEIATEVGKDVPMFLFGSTTYISHFGEVVKEITPLKEMYFLLVHPSFHHKTKEMYAQFDSYGKFSKGIKTQELIKLIESGKYDASTIKNFLYNDFEEMLKEINKKFLNYKQTLETLTDQKFFLTGSGSTLYCPFDTKKEAEEVKKLLEKLKVSVNLVSTKLD